MARKTTVQGLPALRRKCDALARAAPGIALAATREGAEEVRAAIRSTIAGMGLVDTRFMLDHVEVRPSPTGLGFVVGFFTEPFGDEFYPAFVHYGTSHFPGTFFMNAAFDAAAPGATRHMEFVIGVGLGSAAGKG